MCLLLIPTAKGCQGCKDVISNKLLHWFIQKSRFLLLQRLLLAVFFNFVPSDARSYKKNVGILHIYLIMSFSLFSTLCTTWEFHDSTDASCYSAKEPGLKRAVEINPNIETLLSVLGKNSSCLTFTPKDFPFRFFRPIQWKVSEAKNNLTIYILFEISSLLGIWQFVVSFCRGSYEWGWGWGLGSLARFMNLKYRGSWFTDKKNFVFPNQDNKKVTWCSFEWPVLTLETVFEGSKIPNG